ncbi:MAG: hypothetical protein EOM20_03130 [Spartobacteria bacterium]|nr:hypothetical protein [Spartobacteria bacterium]
MNTNDAKGKWAGPRVRRIASYLVLLCLLLMALWVRIEDYRTWTGQPALCFVDGEPVLGALDGYYYLRLARDLNEGTYHPVDEMRHSPRYPQRRPSPPPLLSVLGAWAARLSPWTINQVGLFLPALLGALIVIPMYGIGIHFGGRITGLVAALFAAIAPYYVYRSAMGWFDTDCMNVTWTLMTAWCFLEFGLRKTFWRYLWLAAGFLCTGLFMWWWDQAVQAALILSLLPLGCVGLLYYRPSSRREKTGVLVFAGILLLICLWQGTAIREQAIDFYGRVQTRLIQISEVSASDFPAQKVSTTEQVRPTFMYLVEATTRRVFFFYLALGGLGWLCIKHPRAASVLISPVVVSVLGLLYAERFIVFMAPLIALGQGYLVYRICVMPMRAPAEWPGAATWVPRVRRAAAMLFVVLMAWTPLKALSAGLTSWPKNDALQLSVMAKLETLTPTNAVIWAWWDKGHSVNYWGRRRTIIDGARHGQRFTVCNALPLATTNERFAANFMQFYGTWSTVAFWYVQRGLDCSMPEAMAFVEKVLSAGPDDAREIIRAANLKPVGPYRRERDWLRHFFPPDAPPVYLYLDEHYIELAYWWYWYGTWDSDRREGAHPVYRAVYGLTFGGEKITNPEGFYLDTQQGAIKSGNQWVPLKAIVVRTDEFAAENAYERPQGGRFEMATQSGFGVFMSEDIAESIFNRLFVRIDPTLERFKPVLQHSPQAQVWEVRGDRL